MSDHDMLLGITPFLWLCGITAIIVPVLFSIVLYLDKRDMKKIGKAIEQFDDGRRQ